MEVKAGEGGDDSKMFAHDLGAAYIKWAKNNQLKVEIVWSDDSSISLCISGNKANNIFQQEAGKHCVQRVPPTEKNGRRQTSIVVVMVSKVQEYPRLKLSDSDVEITTMRGSGPGGQHKQKTDTCVRAKHIKTGISVCIDGRSQLENKKLALRVLAERVNDFLEAQIDTNSQKKKQWGGGIRSDKIRTYNFIDSRAVDHRTNIKTKNVREVIEKGKFNLLITNAI